MGAPCGGAEDGRDDAQPAVDHAAARHPGPGRSPGRAGPLDADSGPAAPALERVKPPPDLGELIDRTATAAFLAGEYGELVFDEAASGPGGRTDP